MANKWHQRKASGKTSAGHWVTIEGRHILMGGENPLESPQKKSGSGWSSPVGIKDVFEKHVGPYRVIITAPRSYQYTTEYKLEIWANGRAILPPKGGEGFKTLAEAKKRAEDFLSGKTKKEYIDYQEFLNQMKFGKK
jgi:hypothetical protein